MSSLEEFQYLKITLQDIKLATNNFGVTNCIGRGGFGKVYQGELVISEKLTMVAMKRLNTALGQGSREFWTEIMLLSACKHENLVSLLGFCVEGGENILVYELLPNKSLDLYLSSPDLSWNQRLRICIGAAQGLQYLHTPAEGIQHRVLHRDIKSANILLDHNWNAKIADFGLSKFGPANQQVTYQFTGVVGTPGYCDPLYWETCLLTKESDVYSFGVVLFEVLCGRPCVEMRYTDERRLLPILAQKRYDENRLDTIISTSLKEKISPESLQKFSKIAYQCLKRERTQRPSMNEIVKQLAFALECQEEYEVEKKKELKHGVALESNSNEYWGTKLPANLDAIIRMLKIPHAIYSINKELFSFLHKGCLFDQDKQFFWINNDGKKCVLISPTKFLLTNPKRDDKLSSEPYRDSRFSDTAIYDYEKFQNVKCHIKTSMLSLGTLYTASLVFKFKSHDPKSIKLTKIKWKTKELSVCSTHYAAVTHDKWYSIKMWYFFSHRPDSDFDIVLEELSCPQRHRGLIIQGFEFKPAELKESKDIEADMENDDEEYWEKMLPYYYPRFIRMSDEPLNCISKKELYLRLCEGFLCHHGDSRLWFFICKSTRGICSMLPATDMIEWDFWKEIYINTIPLSESRFPEAIKPTQMFSLDLNCRFESPMFSPHCIYTCYLVFKYQDVNQTWSNHTALFESSCNLDGINKGKMSVHMNLDPINIPTIKPTNDNGSLDSSNTPRNERVEMQKHYIAMGYSKIEERKDGWMEVMLCKPLGHLEDHKSLNIRLSGLMKGIFGEMIIEGIEFRPFT